MKQNLEVLNYEKSFRKALSVFLASRFVFEWLFNLTYNCGRYKHKCLVQQYRDLTGSQLQKLLIPVEDGRHPRRYFRDGSYAAAVEAMSYRIRGGHIYTLDEFESEIALYSMLGKCYQEYPELNSQLQRSEQEMRMIPARLAAYLKRLIENKKHKEVDESVRTLLQTMPRHYEVLPYLSSSMRNVDEWCTLLDTPGMVLLEAMLTCTCHRVQAHAVGALQMLHCQVPSRIQQLMDEACGTPVADASVVAD